MTGGGLAANLARVVPPGLCARIDRSRIGVPPVVALLRSLGGLTWRDVEDTLNMGVGMVALLPEADAEVAEGVCRQAGVEAWQIGRVGAEGASAASPGAPAGRPVPDARGGQRTVRGTKGADAGSVRMSGRYA